MSSRESGLDPQRRRASAPVILSPNETEQVSGGHIKKVNNGPGSAPYNTGATRNTEQPNAQKAGELFRSAPKQPVELTLADGQNVSGGAPTLPLPPPRSERPDPVPW